MVMIWKNPKYTMGLPAGRAWRRERFRNRGIAGASASAAKVREQDARGIEWSRNEILWGVQFCTGWACFGLAFVAMLGATPALSGKIDIAWCIVGASLSFAVAVGTRFFRETET